MEPTVPLAPVPRPRFVADAGPDEVVIYIEPIAGQAGEHARYARGDDLADPDVVLAQHGWTRVSAWHSAARGHCLTVVSARPR